MAKKRYHSSKKKAEIVLEMIEGNSTIPEISAKYQVHPNQLHNWKKEFMENAHLVFEQKNQLKQEKRKEEKFKKKEDRYKKIIAEKELHLDYLRQLCKEIGISPDPEELLSE